MSIAIERRVERNRSEDVHERAFKRAVRHLVGEVEQNGYMRASAVWKAYDPNWFRDSSIAAISLFAAYKDLIRKDPILAQEALEAGRRITSFSAASLRNFLPNIKEGFTIPIEDHSHFNLCYHIPARVGRNLGYYNGILGTRYFERISDNEHINYNTGLRQNDTIPLILLSLVHEEFHAGLNVAKREFLSTNIRTLLEYVGRNYSLECANMWEMEHGFVHSYDVGAADAAFQSARFFAKRGIVDINDKEISRFEKLNGDCPGGPAEFLNKYFIKEGVIYRSKHPMGDIERGNGVDGALAHMLSIFEISDRSLGRMGIEKKTMEIVERDLFGGRSKSEPNALPLRVSFEEYNYFKDGRWLPVGLAFATYYSNIGERKKASSIIDYVIRKWEDGTYEKGLPEQEIIDPMNPNGDHGDYLRSNNGKPIEDLAWSYAALILAISKYEETRRRETFVPILRAA